MGGASNTGVCYWLLIVDLFVLEYSRFGLFHVEGRQIKDLICVFTIY
jgi:hypothetical protein